MAVTWRAGDPAGLVAPKVKVGRCCAPLGQVAMAAESRTDPVKPATGVRVIVEVFPVEAPRLMTTGVPATVNPGATLMVMAAVAVDVA